MEKRKPGQQGVAKGDKRGPYKMRKNQRGKEEFHEDGMSYQEIAELMNLTVQQVKDIENTALKKLRVPTDKNKVLRRYAQISDTPEPGEVMGE